MVAAYILVTLVAGPKLAESLGADVMWTCLAAAATLILVLLLAPDSLRWRGFGESLKEPWVRKALCWVGIAALLGLVANAAILLLGSGAAGDVTALIGATPEVTSGGIFGEGAAAGSHSAVAGAGAQAAATVGGGSAVAGPEAQVVASGATDDLPLYARALLLVASAVAGAGAQAAATVGGGSAVAGPEAQVVASGATDDLPLYARALLLVACCFSTAVFEEGFFRGIVVPCAARRTQMEIQALQQGNVGLVARETYSQMTPEERREASNVPYSAAVFSGLLFGVVHIMSGMPNFAGADMFAVALMVAEGLGKAVQAGMFGYVMAALMLRSGSVFGPMVTHFLFDMLYFAPVVLATGALPAAYMTGAPSDVLLLAITIAALVPAMRAASSWLKDAGPSAE